MTEIKKIIAIRNVGKFRTCQPKGDVELRKINLIYAGNARGKTTLCEILRSLQSGDASHVNGRRTLGEKDEPFVELRLDGRNCKLDRGLWSETVDQIAIFDSSFVNENVHAGHFVELDNKRNMYGVVVGAVGVALQRQIDKLDSESREAAKRLRDARLTVERVSPTGFTVEKFVSLEPLGNIDQRLTDKRNELAMLGRSKEISEKPMLQEVSLPDVPNQLEKVLNRTIEGLAADAEKHVRDHLANNTSGATEEWLARGVMYKKADNCPFCGQSVLGLDLISSYSTFFAEEYRALHDELNSIEVELTRMSGEAAYLSLRLLKEQNESLIDFWRQLLECETPQINLDDAFAALQSVRIFAERLLEAKKDSLLSRITVDEVFEAATNALALERAKVDNYNRACREINSLIAEKKKAVQRSDITAVRAEIAELSAIKSRFEPAADAICGDYSRASADKQAIETQKENTKRDLDAHTSKTFPAFERRINELLFQFGADFRIQNVRPGFSGGRVSSQYQIVINRVPVELGDSSTPVSVPSFRNTLSAGDRSTLALAFFITQMELDPELSEKIIIFDDPFTSQDSSRRTCTQQRICRLAAEARQVFVLSHEAGFLRLIYDCVNNGDVKTLQLAKVGAADTIITQWNIDDATQSDYHKDLVALQRYANESQGDPRDVAGKIRLAVEGHLRSVFPNAFPQGEWLGDFIGRIRSAVERDRLSEMKPVLQELEDINDYSKKHHHRGNGSSSTSVPVDENELLAYVQRTLVLIGAAATN